MLAAGIPAIRSAAEDQCYPNSGRGKGATPRSKQQLSGLLWSRLWTAQGQRRVTVLLDNGSTYYFICACLAQWPGCSASCPLDSRVRHRSRRRPQEDRWGSLPPCCSTSLLAVHSSGVCRCRPWTRTWTWTPTLSLAGVGYPATTCIISALPVASASSPVTPPYSWTFCR